jgi:predicted amidohydrolase
VRRIALLLLLVAGSAPATALASPPETLRARVVSWDVGWKPRTGEEWIARVIEEVREARRDGVDVLVFPELFAWGLAPYAPKDTRPASFITHAVLSELLPSVSDAAGPEMLVVLGSYPHELAGWDHAFNRSPVLVDGRWRFVDKLDPTPGEKKEDPPIRPGHVLPLFRYRGGRVAVVICFSLEMPEVAVALKRHGVQMVLAPSSTEDEDAVARVLRSASARAVELGAAVLVAPLLGEQGGWSSTGSAALYLPAQKGIDHASRESVRRSSGFARDDFIVPWKRLLELRNPPAEEGEPRPFLAPSPPFEVELDGAAPVDRDHARYPARRAPAPGATPIGHDFAHARAGLRDGRTRGGGVSAPPRLSAGGAPVQD